MTTLLQLLMRGKPLSPDVIRQGRAIADTAEKQAQVQIRKLDSVIEAMKRARGMAVIALLLALSSCVRSFRHGHDEAIPYKGSGPLFRYEVSPKAIDASPEVAPILETMYLHQAASALDVLTFDQPLLVPVTYQGKDRYQLVQPWSFPYNGIEQAVPLGIIVDGASVPRIFWIFMPPDGAHRAAALAHDLVYQLAGKLNGVTLTRLDADQMLYNMMRRAGVGRVRAGIVYDAVRACGGSSWGAHSPIVLPVEHRMFAARIVSPRHLFSHIYQP